MTNFDISQAAARTMMICQKMRFRRRDLEKLWPLELFRDDFLEKNIFSTADPPSPSQRSWL